MEARKRERESQQIKRKERRGKERPKKYAFEYSALPQYHRLIEDITQQQPYAWEASYTRSWDTVQEDETGSLQTAVEELLARGRRRR